MSSRRASVVKDDPPRMTALFRKAVERASKEFPDYEQDEFARWLLAAIENDERRWDAAFNDLTKLANLARKAQADFREGRTKPLDPNKL